MHCQGWLICFRARQAQVGNHACLALVPANESKAHSQVRV